MSESGIYTIQNNVNEKLYVGSAVNIPNRRAKHFGTLRASHHHSKHLQASYNKYGEDAFSFHVLLYCDKENLLMFEQRAIDMYRGSLGWKMLYNKRMRAESNIGIIVSPETRERLRISLLGKRMPEEVKEKIRIANTGKKRTDETRAKMSMALRGNTRAKGHKHSPETRAKLSVIGRKYNVGRVASAEARMNMSNAHKDHQVSEEQRLKTSKTLTGHTVSNETRAKISASLKGRKLSVETKNKISRSLEGNTHALGYKHSSATRDRMSEAQKKRRIRERARISLGIKSTL